MFAGRTYRAGAICLTVGKRLVLDNMKGRDHGVVSTGGQREEQALGNDEHRRAQAAGTPTREPAPRVDRTTGTARGPERRAGSCGRSVVQHVHEYGGQLTLMPVFSEFLLDSATVLAVIGNSCHRWQSLSAGCGRIGMRSRVDSALPLKREREVRTGENR